jgi:hypothetical protein
VEHLCQLPQVFGLVCDVFRGSSSTDFDRWPDRDQSLDPVNVTQILKRCTICTISVSEGRGVSLPGYLPQALAIRRQTGVLVMF